MKRHQQLTDRGITTAARVVSHTSNQSSRRSPTYHLTVEFTPTNATPITRTIQVVANDYHASIKTGSVIVRYLPEDPDVCAAGNTSLIPFQGVFILGLAMFGAGLIVTLVVFKAASPSTAGSRKP